MREVPANEDLSGEAVQDLMLRVDEDAVVRAMLIDRPEEETNILGYRRVFRDLQTMTPQPDDMVCRVDYTQLAHTDEPAMPEIDGVFVDRSDEQYALELTDWPVWLGMRLFRTSRVTSWSDARVAAAILYEMTFFGFDQAKVQQERTKLKTAASEAEDQPAESADVVLDKLNEFDDR